jgi:hypothetical protein
MSLSKVKTRDYPPFKKLGRNVIKNINANYTFSAEDVGKILVVNGAYTLTIGAGFLPGVGCQIDIIAQGGVVVVTSAGGPTLNSPVATTTFSISPQYGACRLIQSTETSWVATGNLIS